MIALGQAAPTTTTPSNPDAAPTTTTDAPITSKISALKVSAIRETYAVLTEIYELEKTHSKILSTFKKL